MIHLPTIGFMRRLILQGQRQSISTYAATIAILPKAGDHTLSKLSLILIWGRDCCVYLNGITYRFKALLTFFSLTSPSRLFRTTGQRGSRLARHVKLTSAVDESRASRQLLTHHIYPF